MLWKAVPSEHRPKAVAIAVFLIIMGVALVLS